MTEAARVVAVLGGTGREGLALARRWTRSTRYRVVIGSRDPARAARAAGSLRGQATGPPPVGMRNDHAAVAADVAVLAVPAAAQRRLLAELRGALQGKTLIDLTVRRTRVETGGCSCGLSAAEEAQRILGPGVRVVAAFQTVGAAVLEQDARELECDVLVSGDDAEGKAEAVALAGAAGMRGLDVGPLALAGVVEGMVAMLIALNRRRRAHGAGIRITGI